MHPFNGRELHPERLSPRTMAGLECSLGLSKAFIFRGDVRPGVSFEPMPICSRAARKVASSRPREVTTMADAEKRLPVERPSNGSGMSENVRLVRLACAFLLFNIFIVVTMSRALPDAPRVQSAEIIVSQGD